MALQQKLNDIIQAHQSNPENNSMFVRGKGINGFAAHGHKSCKLRLAPRRRTTSALTPVDLKIKAKFHQAAKNSLVAALAPPLKILEILEKIRSKRLNTGSVSACHQNYNLICR